MALSVAVSCVDDRNNFMVDDSLGLSIASGENVIELYAFEGKYEFSVIKSGKGFTGAKATVESSNFYLLEYNEANKTSYVPLPSECYKLSTDEVTFTDKEVSQKVTLTWDVDMVHQVLEEEPLCDFAIPIRVVSTDLEVNEARKLIVISISKPVLDFKKTEHETLAVLAEARESVESIPMKLTTGYPEDVTVTLAVENDLAKDYIARKRLEGYTTIPEEISGLVRLPENNQMVIPAGSTDFNLDLTINTKVFFNDGDTALPELFEGYVLPIRATSASTKGVVIGSDLIYVLITSTYVLPLEFTEIWGLYTGGATASWFTSSVIGGEANGDRNLAVDSKYVYVPDCQGVGLNYSVFRFAIEDGTVSKMKLPANPIKGDGFTSCAAKIMKNGVDGVNGGEDFLVVTNMTQSGGFILYAYSNGVDAAPETITLTGAEGRLGDRVSIYGNLKDGVEIIAKDMTGENIYSFKMQGSLPSSVTAQKITVDGTSTVWQAGGLYPHPSDRNTAVMTTSAASYFVTSTDGYNFSISNWSSGFEGLANCLDINYFTVNDIEYVAFMKLESSNKQGRVMVIENKGGVNGLKSSLEKSFDEKAPIAFSTPTQDPLDFEVSSGVPTANSAGGLAIYETESSVFMAALQQSGGLSVYKLNK